MRIPFSPFSRSFINLPLLTITCAAAIAACGGGNSNTTSSGTGGGGSGTGGSGGSGGMPMPSPFGLDTRPVNATCKAPQRPSTTPVAVKLDKVFNGVPLNAPMGLTQIPGDPSRFFVFQRAGNVISIPAADPSQWKIVLTIPKTVNGAGEGGLLGFAFHPKAKQNGRVYFSYTTNGGGTGMRSVVARMTSTDDFNTFGDYQDVLGPFDQPYTNHNGGDAHFGLDGYLYLSFGDGGAGGDPLGHGQNTNTFFSKILRIDVDSGAPYGIPNGNPFKSGGGEPATFAYGFRNPFRFSVDRVSGDVWVGDVGQGAWEEVDAKVVAGGNYGWNTREGAHCYSPMSNCPTAGLIDPIYEYDHVAGKSITGGVVYRGKAIPSLVGAYLFADYVSQAMWSLVIDPDTGKPVVTQINANGPNGNWVYFGEDNDGEVYAVDLNNNIYKLNPQGMTPPPSNFPDKLSKTGCVDPQDPKKPATGLIPYEPHSPLWSDGAEKLRWLALPEGAKITIQPDGDFDFPIGSVLVKSFKVGGKLVETRLMIRHDDGGWAGYTYEWDDAQTDATLLPANKQKPVTGQSWYYPSRAECFACHTGAAGRTLGLEIGQLNADFVYTETNRVSNQLATLDHIGLFNAALPGPVSSLTAYPRPGTSEGTVETRARAYLHSNCGVCHRPNGNGGGNMDLRYETAFNAASVCGADPQDGDLGIAGAKIFAPGDPAHSLISVRPKATGAGRMPPLASQLVDKTGTAEIDAWIQSVSSCPAP